MFLKEIMVLSPTLLSMLSLFLSMFSPSHLVSRSVYFVPPIRIKIPKMKATTTTKAAIPSNVNPGLILVTKFWYGVHQVELELNPALVILFSTVFTIKRVRITLTINIPNTIAVPTNADIPFLFMFSPEYKLLYII